jgi:STE24 endopeptidase
MAALAPESAADAWLNRIPLAERAAAAAATDARLLGWWLGWALIVAVSALVLRSGLLGRLRRAIERDGPRPWLTSAALACAFALILLVVKTPFDAANDWWNDQILHRAGGTAAGYGAHLSQAMAGAGQLLCAAVIVAPILLWLARRAPKRWPLIAGGAAIALCLGIYWVPYALSAGPAMSPLPAGPMRQAMLSLVHDAGIPASEIYRSTDPGVDVDVTGGFGRASVSVGPRMAGGSVADARAMAGHLMGHYAHGDIFSIWLMFGAFTLLGFLAVQAAFAPLARLLGAGELKGPADPEGLPVAAIIAVAAMIAATLVSSAAIRWMNVRADEFSLTYAREPDGLAAGLERDWNHQAVDPSPLARAVFYTHPPMRGRLIHAMAWKAAHGG